MLSSEQLEVRGTGLGGTDLVAIVGEDPYRSAIDVYLEKRVAMGLPIDMEAPRKFTGNERTEWGHVLEKVLADRYAKDTGVRLVEPTTMRNPRARWHLGTPDRLGYEEKAERGRIRSLDAITGEPADYEDPDEIWEGKSHGLYGGKRYDLENLEVPDDKRIQVASYMALTGCKKARLSALFDTHLYRLFHVPHDQEVEDYLLEEGDLFWRRILEGNPPEPDGSEAFSRYLSNRFKLHTADMVQVKDDNLLGQIELYRLLRSQVKQAEEAMELAQQKIKSSIGEHAGLLNPDGSVAVTWKRKSVGTTSWAKVAKKLREKYQIDEGEFEQIVQGLTGEPSRVFIVK